MITFYCCHIVTVAYHSYGSKLTICKTRTNFCNDQNNYLNINLLQKNILSKTSKIL